jgi:hypothetical protein
VFGGNGVRSKAVGSEERQSESVCRNDAAADYADQRRLQRVPATRGHATQIAPCDVRAPNATSPDGCLCYALGLATLTQE